MPCDNSEISPFLGLLETQYEAYGYSDYKKVVDAIDMLPISDDCKVELRGRFPPREVAAPASWEDGDDEEDFSEAYLKNPPDPGPLANFSDHGWIDDSIDDYREDKFCLSVRGRTGIPDPDVLHDITENTLHILGRCNNPEDWGGENRQGLVFGMVQSGKTASMINLVAMGIKAGYKLFIVLAGDKSSLRDQTQERFNSAFDLINGTNKETRIHSPTYKEDFGSTGFGYKGSFLTQKLIQGKQFVTLIVIKKEANHLKQLLAQIKQLEEFCKFSGNDMAETFPTMILDDEADYASQNTKPSSKKGSKIWNRLCKLRHEIPRNCYAAYTATPQACLSADTKCPIGYPNDFFWLLEPFAEASDDGQLVTRTYLGAWDVFWQYDQYLVRDIGRDEWPHYEKKPDGKDGIYFPNKDGEGGQFEDWEDIDEEDEEEPRPRPSLDKRQLEFLKETRDGKRPIPPSLESSMADFLVGCGLRWWDHWKRKNTSNEFPTLLEITQSYPNHAMMVHLSRLQEHQEVAREVTEVAWQTVKQSWSEFDIDSDSDHLFRDRWSEQMYRRSRLKSAGHVPFSDICRFIDIAIDIVDEPIKNDKNPHYTNYAGDPYIYLVNSSDTGMRLHYDEKTKDEAILVKKAAIIVGGAILSRGLTIEGLSVSFFGRAAKLPMGDTTLQMGRWFGHKKGDIDMISIYMQSGVKLLFRQIAEADRYLRIQIKDAIFRGLRPDQILIELRNSPHFRSTSSNKSKFVNFSKSSGFGGRRALLRQPILREEAVRKNNRVIDAFQKRNSDSGHLVHGARATLYTAVSLKETLTLLNNLKCDRDAVQDSFADYAKYLKDWSESNEGSPVPTINIAVMENIRKRSRILSTSKPESEIEAREADSGIYGAVMGGASPPNYQGDYFLDRSEEWHKENSGAKSERAPGEDILIVFYRLHPNYLRNRLFDSDDTDAENPHGKWRTQAVYLQEGDRHYLDFEEGDRDGRITLFAAMTPSGGPQYGIGTNQMLDPEKIQQIGLRNLMETGMED